MMLKTRPIIAAFIVSVVGIGAWQMGLFAPRTSEAKDDAKKSQSDEYYELMKVLVDTIDQVERNYVKDVDRRELIEAAIAGVLKKLDQHSTYINPKNLDRFRTSVESEFGGIGIQVAIDRGRIRIISPLVGSPAYRAGTASGRSDHQDRGRAAGRYHDRRSGAATERKARHKGDVHSPSSQWRNRRCDDQTREIVKVATVMGDHRNDDDSWDFMFDEERRIGYIRLTAFSRNTTKRLRDVLTKLKADGMRGLVLDLRFNPGGLLTAAIQISDLFLCPRAGLSAPKAATCLSKVGTPKRKERLPVFQIVVLVNRYSASASEIVSASLQDHNRAIIVGERTFGKGSVQNVITLEDGKSASETDHRRLFPAKRQEHRQRHSRRQGKGRMGCHAE